MSTTPASNVHRWLDSNTGRYTASDPLGVQGGSIHALNLLYAYAAGNPLLHVDPLGLAVVTSGCSPEQDRRIQGAAGQAEAGARDCIKCNPKPWTDKIRNTIYHCVSYFEQGRINAPENNCAQASDETGSITGGDVAIFDDGFNNNAPEDCGCLQSIVLHEVAHLMGFDDPAAGDLAKRCFSCARNQ